MIAVYAAHDVRHRHFLHALVYLPAYGQSALYLLKRQQPVRSTRKVRYQVVYKGFAPRASKSALARMDIVSSYLCSSIKVSS